MTDNVQRVLDQMPRHEGALRERMLIDPEFRSLCEDYGDALEALERWHASSDDARREARVAEFRSLANDLEAEILAALGDAAQKPDRTA